MSTNEVLKLALEALEYIHEGANNQGPHTGISWRCVSNKAEPAITVLREALAEQPAQQVVDCHATGVCVQSGLRAEQPAQQQEPVAWVVYEADGTHHNKPCQHPKCSYPCPDLPDCRDAEPAQRTWVGLTDEERRGLLEWQKIQEELGPVWAPMMLYLYDAIEAKLKEKNT